MLLEDKIYHSGEGIVSTVSYEEVNNACGAFLLLWVETCATECHHLIREGFPISINSIEIIPETCPSLLSWDSKTGQLVMSIKHLGSLFPC